MQTGMDSDVLLKDKLVKRGGIKIRIQCVFPKAYRLGIIEFETKILASLKWLM